MGSKFTEKDTEEFYDGEDEIYRSFWDKEGSLHWGYFDGCDFSYIDATKKLTKIMAEKAEINSSSKVLDLGCGNGIVALELAKNYGCNIIGIDLSGVRIKNAKDKLKNLPVELRNLIKFEKASATNLPFKDDSFSQVISQATIYHVHDKIKALEEIYRVLESGGAFVFDDLLKPISEISENSKKYVYDRLLFDTDFSFTSYKKSLNDIGFEIIFAEDISSHLKRSYEELIKLLEKVIVEANNPKMKEKFKKLILAYDFMVKAIEKEELGWGLFLCRKRL